MPAGQLTSYDFSTASLHHLLGDGQPVKYLDSYLSALDANSILVEAHYVDRHYLDEFSHYYSSSFAPPAPHCERLHFFSGLTKPAMDALVSDAYTGLEQRDAAEKALTQHYLGFVIRRPLDGARIGRTVLKTYPVEGRRHYNVVRPYVANVAGLRLTVQGLAYQQQDRGAAVCASTALWSALQRVAYISGDRTPTPSAITRAARSPYPASTGLSAYQMASALDSLGYLAEGLSPANNRALFRAEIVSYLQSHLPVILLVTKKVKTGTGDEISVGHAVTVTGFSESRQIVEVPPQNAAHAPIKMASGALDIIYVHDDNIGSHAHYELFDSDEVNSDGHKKLMLRRGHSGSPAVAWWTPDVWEIQQALVPKPRKLRLSIGSLFDGLQWMHSPMATVFAGFELHFAVRFASGVDYKRDLFKLGVDFDQLRNFQASLTLPRYVGVISVFTEKEHLCDVLFDVSEVSRKPHSPTTLGLVAPKIPLMSPAHMNLLQLAGVLKSPLITGPQSDM